MTTSPVVAYFDGVAGVYDQVLPFFAGFARQAAGALTLPRGAQVLDLAAGRMLAPQRGIGLQGELWVLTDVITGAIYLVCQLPRAPR